MRIAVLGTGMVGNAIASQFVKDPGRVPLGCLGHATLQHRRRMWSLRPSRSGLR